jgi:hypothetical protein
VCRLWAPCCRPNMTNIIAMLLKNASASKRACRAEVRRALWPPSRGPCKAPEGPIEGESVLSVAASAFICKLSQSFSNEDRSGEGAVGSPFLRWPSNLAGGTGIQRQSRVPHRAAAPAVRHRGTGAAPVRHDRAPRFSAYPDELSKAGPKPLASFGTCCSPASSPPP